METNLAGRVAIVTGAGRGIGRAIALEFAKSSADLVLVDLNLAALNSLKRGISDLGVKILVCQADVSQKSDVESVVKRALRDFKKVDILVNNAGTIIRKPMEDYVEDDWDRVIDVNLKSVFNFCHAACKSMIIQHYGRIINMASIMGETALPPRSSYCASKGGIIALTKDLAAEWAKYGITVNAISPGWVETELTKNYFTQKRVRNFLLSRIPLGRFALPEEIANLAVFLASDKSAYITGQNLFIDGGWTAV